MITLRPTPKLRLQGFNNLTKTLSFNKYDIGYTSTTEQQERYLRYLEETYNAARLTDILSQVAKIIGATILNVARQDYEPHGASVTLLLAAQSVASEALSHSAAPGPLPDAVVCHLDKSHITVHTYPESHPDNGIHTFRADIDVSTCGRISPLKALNYLMQCFAADIIVLDYRVRGFARDETGKKHFIDHQINSIQDYLSSDIRERYQLIDVNVSQEHLFHTKMLLKDFDLNDYLLITDPQDMSPHEQAEIERQVRREMAEIFYGENLPKGWPV